MSDAFTDEHATRIVAAIETRQSRKLKSGSFVQNTWGTVASVASDGKTAGAYLYGETDGAYISDGFRVPETTYLTIGQKVKVAMDYGTGDRWIEEVNVPATAYKKVALDLATGQVLTGDGTVPPTDALPAGVIAMWAAAATPAGWLACQGVAVSRLIYSSLFAVIGTTYGAGDGSTTFNLPNFVGRFPVGVNAGDASWDILGELGGTSTHTHAGHANHSVTQPSAHPDHAFTQPSGHAAHAVTQPANHVITSANLEAGANTVTSTSSGRTAAVGAQGSFVVSLASGAGTPVAHSGAAVDGHSAHAGGGVDSHSAHGGTAVDAHSGHDSPLSVPPYIAINFIIKF